MRLVLMALILITAGCAQLEPRTVEVKVPVPVACLNPSDIPEPMVYPVDELVPGVSDGEIIGALMAERSQRVATENLLRNLLNVCIGKVE
jgi:hypothetical protein